MTALARAASTERLIASAIDQDRIVDILRIAHDAAAADSETPPRHGDVVWYAIKEAMDTLRRLPDRDAGWLYCIRNSHPEVLHDHAERLEAFEVMVQRLRMGEIAQEAVEVRRPPSPQAISRMDMVFRWHEHLKGKNRRRDWKILCLVAQGKPATLVANVVHCSRQTVYSQREFQCVMIARGLVEKFGEGVFPEALARS